MVANTDPPERSWRWLEEMAVEVSPAQAEVFRLLVALLAVLLVSGVRLPAPAVVAARAVYEGLVPVQVRRIMGFDLKGLASLGLWAARRRDVPAGAVPVGYSAEQTTTMLMLLFAMLVELVGIEFLLRALDWPPPLRALIFVIDLSSVLIVLAVIAACVTRPHLVSPGELRLRYGVFFDLRVPRELVSSVRVARNYDEKRLLTLEDGLLALAVGSQTNVIVELDGPVAVTRPLGGRGRATTLRFFADDPSAALRALRPLDEGNPCPA